MTERRPEPIEEQTRRFKAELAELLAAAAERHGTLTAPKPKRGGKAA